MRQNTYAEHGEGLQSKNLPFFIAIVTLPFFCVVVVVAVVGVLDELDLHALCIPTHSMRTAGEGWQGAFAPSHRVIT
jgi:hypothetical protein